MMYFFRKTPTWQFRGDDSHDFYKYLVENFGQIVHTSTLTFLVKMVLFAFLALNSSSIGQSICLSVHQSVRWSVLRSVSQSKGPSVKNVKKLIARPKAVRF